jgi:hypothetical protein
VAGSSSGGAAGDGGAGGAAGSAGSAGTAGTAGTAGSAGVAGSDAGQSGGQGGTDAGDAAPDVPSAPAPTVLSIAPNNGLANHPTPSVVITGTDLQANAQVTVVGVNVVACNFSGVPTSITCTIPAKNSVARGDVVVTNPDSQSDALTDGFTFTGVLNETNLASEADFCNLQFPASANITLGQPSPLVFGRIYENGVTPLAGASASVLAELGYGPAVGSPTNDGAWRFVPATFNLQVGNDDEYQATITPTAVGSYLFTYRVSLDGGFNYTYCDTNGAGSNGGLSFEPNQLGTLVVTP